MKINTRYIFITLLTYTLTVFLVWLSIYSFFNFLAEIDSVGKGDYTSFKAMKYIALKIPEVIHNHATSIILVGSVLGMGHLSTTNQLVVLRISGASIFKMTMLTIKISLFFIFLTIVIGEFLAPWSTQFAEKQRSNALGISSISSNQDGFWIKDESNFINVKQNFDGKLFVDINIFEVDSSNQLKIITKAEDAIFDGKNIQMNNANIYKINNDKNINNIDKEYRKKINRPVSFDKELIEDLKKSPEDLTTWKIIKQINYLSDNKLRSIFFEIELYKRLIKPFTLIAMIMIGMLFIFESDRNATLGRKIFFGVTIALSFEMFARLVNAFAIGFNLNPIIISILPTLVVMCIAFSLLLRKSIK
jgi:lipopolysaccharide export system permease protein